MNNCLLAVGMVAPHPVLILPFALMLMAIALMPFIHRHWWERNFPKVAVGLGGISVVYYGVVLGNMGRMTHTAHEYVSFIVLIGSLYIVAGGIHIDLRTEARPWVNSLFLLLGAILANLVGTTGASMLLVRPWIRINRHRIAAFHVVFFIFIVSNAGGCLTPVGDPPLFLGYLKGVPFWWALQNCWAAWVVAVGGLVAIFYHFDRRNFLRTPRASPDSETRGAIWKIEGWRNVGFLGLILVAVFIKEPVGLSEFLMAAAAVGSWFATPKPVHQSNEFDFHPLREVAWLFLGIFATMAPALDYLEVHASDLGLDSGMKFFWLTGVLSGALDNAPTYLTFLAAAMGLRGLSLENSAHVLQLVATGGRELAAISLGAVFFGATSYIGNGPNFMVKSIAERANVPMPTFFAYTLKYAVPIFIPIMILISILFFSHWRIF